MHLEIVFRFLSTTTYWVFPLASIPAVFLFGEQKEYKKMLETKDLQRINTFATLLEWSEMARNGLKLV